MADPFESPKARVGRAKHHLQNLVSLARAFVDSHPYRQVVETHLNGTRDIHKVVLTEPVPLDLTMLGIEIVEHLRGALDNAGYAAAVIGGATNPKNTYFPIADSALALERDVIGRGRCKDLPPDILTLFRGFKPYDGGNIPVWLVNRLANMAKHRFLITAAMQTDGIDIGYFMAQRDGTELPSLYQWDSVKDEMVIGATNAGAPFYYNFQFAFFIAFGPIDPVKGQPVISVLSGLISEVERIVLATEAECRRLGLIT